MAKELEAILEEAKKCPQKRRLYVYEQFKRKLENLNLPAYDYGEACRLLAKYLEV